MFHELNSKIDDT